MLNFFLSLHYGCSQQHVPLSLLSCHRPGPDVATQQLSSMLSQGLDKDLRARNLRAELTQELPEVPQAIMVSTLYKVSPELQVAQLGNGQLSSF